MNVLKHIHGLVLCPFILMCLHGCVKDAPFKFTGPVTPERLNDGWDVASPEEVDIDPGVFVEIHAALLSDNHYFNAKSLLVVKDNKLIFEAYCRTPADRDRYSHIASATKSITSLIVGIVKAAGYIDSLEETLFSIFPEKFPATDAKRSITIAHLLTMTSGLSFDNDDFSLEVYADKPADPIKYILSKPMYAQPGEEFYYRDCDPHLMSYTIQRLTGRTEEQCAAEWLFSPLGIHEYYWDSDHAGTTTGAYGLHLKPRDLAKIGQMVMDHGNWQGQQIVDSAWIAVSTKKQIETPYSNGPEIRDYGYYWWILPEWQAIEAWGHGGNSIFIMPQRRMVIVMTSLPDTDDDIVGTRPEQFRELISPLLQDE